MNKILIALGMTLLLTSCGTKVTTLKGHPASEWGALVRSQQVYHLDNGQFAQSINELDTSFDSEYYEYSISSASPDSVAMVGTPKNVGTPENIEDLKTITGGVIYNDSDESFSFIKCRCESSNNKCQCEIDDVRASLEPLSLLEGLSTCPDGSTRR